MTGSREEASGALNGIRLAQRRLAGRARWSMVRHLGFAGLMAAMVASLALPVFPRLLLTVALLIGAALIVRRDKTRDGMFVNGWRFGRTFWVSLGTVAVVLTLTAAGQWVDRVLSVGWATLAAAAIVLPIGLGASLLWEYVYREELGA